MSTLRLMKNRLFDTTTTITASSEDAAFPVANLSKHIRAKTWRSTGNFVIDATNDNLDFDDGGGEENATIASATYTPTGLAAAIKSAMEALTGDTITVSFSTASGKWTIASSGGTLSLLWDTGTNTATTIGDTIGFDTSADDTGATSYVSDDIALHTEETVTNDLGSALAVDSVAIVFDPLDGSKLSASAVVKIQANATDVWTAPSVDVTLSFDATYNSYTHFFSSDQTFRYWRLQIVDPENTNIYVEIPKLILSDSIQLSQMAEIGFPHEMRDRSKKFINDYGHEYFDIYPQQQRISYTYKVLTETDADLLLELFKDVGNVVPIGVALDVDEVLFDKDKFFIYGRMQGAFKQTQVFRDFFDTGFDILEAL